MAKQQNLLEQVVCIFLEVQSLTTHTIIFLGLFDLNYGRYQQNPTAFDQYEWKDGQFSQPRQAAGGWLSGLYNRNFDYPDWFQLTSPVQSGEEFMPKNKVVTGQTSFVLYTNNDNTIKVGVIIQGERSGWHKSR
jgi:hypothetical protein